MSNNSFVPFEFAHENSDVTTDESLQDHGVEQINAESSSDDALPDVNDVTTGDTDVGGFDIQGELDTNDLMLEEQHIERDLLGENDPNTIDDITQDSFDAVSEDYDEIDTASADSSVGTVLEDPEMAYQRGYEAAKAEIEAEQQAHSKALGLAIEKISELSKDPVITDEFKSAIASMISTIVRNIVGRELRKAPPLDLIINKIIDQLSLSSITYVECSASDYKQLQNFDLPYKLRKSSSLNIGEYVVTCDSGAVVDATFKSVIDRVIKEALEVESSDL